MNVAIVDTNVAVSGIITRDDDAPTARILDAMLAGRFLFLLSVDLLAEYRTVLLRPKIRALHGLSTTEVDVVLTRLATNGALHDPGPAPPDPGDAHIWALLACQADTVLVTGDQALLDHPPAFARVFTPARFAALLDAPPH